MPARRHCRDSLAVTPDRVRQRAEAGSQALQVSGQAAVEVAGEEEAAAVKVVTALRGALVDDVVDHDPAGEVGARDLSEWTPLARLQPVQGPHQIAFPSLLDRGQDGQPVGLAADVPRVAQRSPWTLARNDA